MQQLSGVQIFCVSAGIFNLEYAAYGLILIQM